MSDRLDVYKSLEREKERLLDRMDKLWHELTDEERASLNARTVGRGIQIGSSSSNVIKNCKFSEAP